MASTKVLQRSFTGGEISPAMYGRIDDAKYQAGLESCKNFIVQPQGPVENRPGFAYVTHCKFANKQARLIPFAYNDDQTMVIELGDKYARFHTQGKTLMNADGSAPYEIETPWSAADIFDVHYVQSADVVTLVHPAYAPVELRRYSLTDWRIVPVSYKPSLTPPTGVAAVRAQSAADDKNSEKYIFEYKVSALNADKTAESEASGSVSVVANLYAYGTTVKISWNAVPGATWYRIYKNQGGLYGYIGDTDGTSIIDDNIEPDTSITPRRHDQLFTQAGGITSVKVKNGGSGYAPTGSIVGVAPGTTIPGFKSYSVVDRKGSGSGAAVELTWQSSSNYTLRVINPGVNYVDPVLRLAVPFMSMNGYLLTRPRDVPLIVSKGITCEVVDQTGTGAEIAVVASEAGSIVSATVRYGGAGYTSPTVRVVSEGGSGAVLEVTVGTAGSYPAAVGYFEQRRCFAGMRSDPQRIIMSRSSTESDFSYSLPTRDEDRISYQIAVTQFNQIRHIVPLSQLLLLTSGAEVRIDSLNSDALTPTSFSARTQAAEGASNVQPVMVNNNLIYCAARGGHVREFAYQYQAGGFVTSDLCLRAPHLFDFKTIRDMTYSKAPFPILWFVSSDGSLLGLTYVASEGVGAWHRHETDGAFESCACVAEGDEDVLYCVVRRGDQRFVERMAPRNFAEQKDAFFVDCGGTYAGDPVTKITGLSWLEGKTVSILADGAVLPQQVVKGGAITLDAPARVVHVGLPYTCDIKTLPCVLNDPSYGTGRQKNVTKVFLRVYRSSGIQAGPSFEEASLVEFKQRTTEQPGEASSLVTGEIPLQLKPSWTDSGQVCVRQADPLPVTIQAITGLISA